MAANILLLLPIMEAELDSFSRYTRNCSWQSRAGGSRRHRQRPGVGDMGKSRGEKLETEGRGEENERTGTKMTISEREGGSVRVVGGKKK